MRKEDDMPTKKIFSFKENDYTLKVMRDYAEVNHITESEYVRVAIENFALSNNEIIRRIQKDIYETNKSLSESCAEIFSYLATEPNKSNDSIRAFVKSLRIFEQKNLSSITGNETQITHMISQLDSFINYLNEYSKKYSVGEITSLEKIVESTDIGSLKILKNSLSNNPKEIAECGELVYPFLFVDEYWEYGDGKVIGQFKEMSFVYRLLMDTCYLTKWKNNSQNRIELINAMNKIKI